MHSMGVLVGCCLGAVKRKNGWWCEPSGNSHQVSSLRWKLRVLVGFDTEDGIVKRCFRESQMDLKGLGKREAKHILLLNIGESCEVVMENLWMGKCGYEHLSLEAVYSVGLMSGRCSLPQESAEAGLGIQCWESCVFRVSWTVRSSKTPDREVRQRSHWQRSQNWGPSEQSKQQTWHYKWGNSDNQALYSWSVQRVNMCPQTG